MRFALNTFAALTISVASLGLTACNNNQPASDQQVQDQAAKTTQDVKAGAKQAASDAKVAAANAERKVNDIAAGVREGLKSDTKPGAGTVNINSATEEQLVELPGITGKRAQLIVQGRPYGSAGDLVSKGILTQAQYDRISGQLIAQ